MSSVQSLTLACKLQFSIGLRTHLSTCIESSNLSLKHHVNCYDFFVHLQSMTVNDKIPPATTAASRPQDSSPAGVPSNIALHFQTSFECDRAVAQVLVVSNIHSQPGETHSLLRSRLLCPPTEIPMLLGFSETSCLDSCCLQCGCTFGRWMSCSIATGTGAENLVRSFRKSFGLHSHHLGTSLFTAFMPHRVEVIRQVTFLKLLELQRLRICFPRSCISCGHLALDLGIGGGRANGRSSYPRPILRHSQQRPSTPRTRTVVRDITSIDLDCRNLHR
jgi:hypothetical protein